VSEIEALQQLAVAEALVSVRWQKVRCRDWGAPAGGRM